MTTELTLTDITEDRPPFGSIVRIAPRKLVVFAKHTGNTGCWNCAFVGDHLQCGATKCFGGVYIPKNKYLEMRLLGEL